MRGLVRIPHHVPPRRADLGVDVLVRPDPRALHRPDEAVHAPVAGRRGVRPLGDLGLEPRVVDDEVHVGVASRRGSDVVGGAEGAPERQALVDADRRQPEVFGLADERLSERRARPVAVIEVPAVAVALERRREMRERLPRDDRVGPRRHLHRVQRRPRRPDVRQRLPVQEDPLVLAQGELGHPRDVHDLVGLRAPLGEDRQRREHQLLRVRADEHQVEEVLDRVAHPGVVLAAVLLRERLVEVLAVEDRVQVVLEQVPLDVEHERVPVELVLGGRRLDGRARRHVEVPARRRRGGARIRLVRLPRARVEREHRGGRAAGREQELAA